MYSNNARLNKNLSHLKLNMPGPQIIEFQALLATKPVWRDKLWVNAPTLVQMLLYTGSIPRQQEANIKDCERLCLLRLFIAIFSTLFKRLRDCYHFCNFVILLQCLNQG